MKKLAGVKHSTKCGKIKGGVRRRYRVPRCQSNFGARREQDRAADLSRYRLFSEDPALFGYVIYFTDYKNPNWRSEEQYLHDAATLDNKKSFTRSAIIKNSTLKIIDDSQRLCSIFKVYSEKTIGNIQKWIGLTAGRYFRTAYLYFIKKNISTIESGYKSSKLFYDDKSKSA